MGFLYPGLRKRRVLARRMHMPEETTNVRGSLDTHRYAWDHPISCSHGSTIKSRPAKNTMPKIRPNFQNCDRPM